MFAASKTSRRAAAAAASDPFFDNVTTLLESTGTNGAQNNTFIDSSTNNFTITRNGNTTQGAFSPFGENWSNYFDGTGDCLTVASNAAFGYGTGAFTIECWFNTSNIPPSGAAYLFDQRTTPIQTALTVYISPSATLELFMAGSVPISGGVVTVGTWNHFALSRSGTSTRMFLNGVQVGSTWTDSNNYGNLPVVIAARFSTTENLLTGYISNFRIIKGTALYTANFTPSTVPLQPIQNTSLLTCRDASIVDDSANNFAITRNGDVSVQKFGPFAATTLPAPAYGAFFDGTGDYITAPANAAFQLTGDFTLEAWVYHNAVNTFNNIFGCENGVVSDYVATRPTSVSIRINDAANIVWTASFVTGRWYHIAVTRSSNTFLAFVDGALLTVSSGNTTNSQQMFQTGAAFSVARTGSNTGANFNGYISNARVVKGQALYTSAFTPSTVPLTTTSQGATASNVSLLTCQSNTFIDNSTNNFAITVFGESRPTAFSPFTLQYVNDQPYTPSVFGGSMFFDGVGDVLTLASNAALGFGTGDFTLEMWYYTTVAPTATNVCLYNNGSGNFFLQLRNTAFGIGVVGSAENNAFSFNFVPNQWYHIAVSRSGSTVRGFVNGALAGSGTNSVNYGQNGAVIGGLTSASQLITGYISGLRVIKGTALYTSRFVPQNAPLTAITNTSLLLNATNAGIYDASTINNFETVGNAQVNTSIKRYGLSSVAFDGTGDYLITSSTTASPNLAFGTGAFTVEFWFYATSNSGNRQLFDTRPTGTSSTSQYMSIIYASGNLNYYTAGQNPSISGGAVAINTWHYVALTRSGTSTRLFINGVQVGTTLTDSQNYLVGVNRPIIGADGADPSTANFAGYIQDFRITRGIARYTTTFTPPTAPLPDF